MHAQARCQQRGIDREVVEVLLSHGRRRWRHGAEVCFMDKQSRREMRRALGHRRYARMADRLDAYVVLSGDGVVVTAAKRHGRLKF